MYIKTIDRFLKDVEPDSLAELIRELEKDASAHTGEAERQSWKESLPALARVLARLPQAVRTGCEIVLEARYMVEEKRADAVLAGICQGHSVLLFIENKRWTHLNTYRPDGENTLVDPNHNNQRIDHPARQVTHYKTTLEYTNQFVQDSGVEISALVYLQNARLTEKRGNDGPFDPRYRTLCAQVPMFTKDEEKDMADWIAGHIDGGRAGLARDIYASPIRYSPDYQRLLGNLFGNREQLLTLLDDQQIALFDEITREVTGGTGPCLFLVQGKRGTGKTFVAVALLAYLYQNTRASGLRVRYVEKNRDPRKTLEKEMKVPRQAMISSLRNQTSPYDCLICDESHRMLERVWEEEYDFLDRFLELSRVSVFFYDESQSVHISDYVTRNRILEAARRRGLDPAAIRERSLVYQHRCHEADRFLDAVDRLLDHPELGLEGLGYFGQNDPYSVALVDDPRELFRLIRDKNSRRGKNHSSRVLAGKGRSYGRDWDWTFNNSDYHEKKSIAPLRDSDEALYTWNFGNYGAEVTFASDKDSVDLVGCIDTSQGLDFEYVGVIIAPDLIYDPKLGQIRVCVEGHQRSDPNTGRWNISDTPRIRQVILNTYRVLLSRGEKGCYLYCCDENLQRYLSGIIAPWQAPPPEEDSPAPAPVSPVTVSPAPVPVPPVAEARMTGTVRHVAAGGKYAYIDSGGISYPVNEATVRRMADARELLVEGKTVTFLVRQSSTGKRYAYDLRKL